MPNPFSCLVHAVADGKAGSELKLFEENPVKQSLPTGVATLIADADSRGWLCRPLNAKIEVWDGVSRDDVQFHIAGTAEIVDRIVPAYVFHSWPETRSYTYEATVRNVVRASRTPPTIDKLFWTGHLDSHPFRHVGATWGNGQPDVLITHHAVCKPSEGCSGHVTLADHARYSALIDLPPRGFSGRLPLLLATGRPLIIVDRPWEQWYFWTADGIRPWVHYVPCNQSTEGLTAAWTWIKEHREAAREMGWRAQAFVLANLTTEKVVCRMATRLCPNSTCTAEIAAGDWARTSAYLDIDTVGSVGQEALVPAAAFVTPGQLLEQRQQQLLPQRQLGVDASEGASSGLATLLVVAVLLLLALLAGRRCRRRWHRAMLGWGARKSDS